MKYWKKKIVAVTFLFIVSSGCFSACHRKETGSDLETESMQTELKNDFISESTLLMTEENSTADNESSINDMRESTLDSIKESVTQEEDVTKEESSLAEEDTIAMESTIAIEPEETFPQTTAFVEEGEKNELGVIDGQPIENLPPQTTAAVTYAEASLPYMIKVNRQANCVTVYAKDNNQQYTVPVKSMICSCGRSGYDTPLGTFRISDHYVWRELFGHVYGYYSTRITGSILFHSVPYYQSNPSTLEMQEFDKLGNFASQGCVRLQVKDAKWIHDNCKSGTIVTIYDSADPGPLGRPQAPKIGDIKGVLYGWDPSDPTPGNPWLDDRYNNQQKETTGAEETGETKETDETEKTDEADETGETTETGETIETTVSEETDRNSEEATAEETDRNSEEATAEETDRNSEEATAEETDRNSEQTAAEETTSQAPAVAETTANVTSAEQTAAPEITSKEPVVEETAGKETAAQETTVTEITVTETTVTETIVKETTVKETTAAETTIALTTPETTKPE